MGWTYIHGNITVIFPWKQKYISHTKNNLTFIDVRLTYAWSYYHGYEGYISYWQILYYRDAIYSFMRSLVTSLVAIPSFIHTLKSPTPTTHTPKYPCSPSLMYTLSCL